MLLNVMSRNKQLNNKQTLYYYIEIETEIETIAT